MALSCGLLLASPSAQAQQPAGNWSASPCDANGNAIANPQYDSNYYYLMSGAESGSYTDTYPVLPGTTSDNATYSNLAVPTGIGSYGSGSLSASGTNVFSNNSFWYHVPNTSTTLYANGTRTVDLSGQLVAYYKMYWNAYGSSTPTTPMPSSLSLLLKTHVEAWGSEQFASSSHTNHLTINSTATDGPYNEMASNMQEDDTTPKDNLTIGYHLVQASVDPATGIAKVSLSGQVHMVMDNEVPYGTVTYPSSDPNYGQATTTNGNAYGATYALVSGGLTLASASLGAHSTVDTSAPGNPWDPAHPRFFSGTNCSASASASAISGYVLHAQLLVGGTDVKDYYDTSFVGPLPQGAATGTNQTSASLTVYFDSTHFPDASSIPIQMTVSDTTGKTYDSSLQSSAYNEGYVGYEQTRTSFGQSAAAVVDSAMTSCNTGHNDSTTSDTRDAVLAGVKFNTDFFTYSYGQHLPDANNHISFEPPAGVGNSNGIIFGNQTFDPSSTPQSPRNDVAEAVASKKVNPPPHNFVYLDICNGGYNTEFADGFGVSASGNTDRAFLGWNGWVEDSMVNQKWTQLLYAYLQSGETLSQALKDADNISGGPPQDNNPNNSTYHLACPHPVYGDTAMTLHGTVYAGTKGSWFK